MLYSQAWIEISVFIGDILPIADIEQPRNNFEYRRKNRRNISDILIWNRYGSDKTDMEPINR